VSALSDRSPAMMAGRAMALLQEISITLGRLLELQQAPRLNYLAVGSVAGAGTASSTGPTVVLAPNPRRRGLSVQNRASAGNLTIGLGVSNPIINTGLVLAPGASWDGRLSGAVWPGAVNVIADAASVAFSWVQVTGPSSMPVNEAL